MRLLGRISYHNKRIIPYSLKEGKMFLRKYFNKRNIEEKYHYDKIRIEVVFIENVPETKEKIRKVNCKRKDCFFKEIDEGVKCYIKYLRKNVKCNNRLQNKLINKLHFHKKFFFC